MDLSRVGRQLREARREAGDLSLRKVAADLEISYAQLGQIERGSPTRTETLSHLAAYYGLRAEVLLVPEDVGDTQNRLLDALGRALPKLDDKDADLILGMLQIIADR